MYVGMIVKLFFRRAAKGLLTFSHQIYSYFVHLLCITFYIYFLIEGFGENVLCSSLNVTETNTLYSF